MTFNNEETIDNNENVDNQIEDNELDGETQLINALKSIKEAEKADDIEDHIEEEVVDEVEDEEDDELYNNDELDSEDKTLEDTDEAKGKKREQSKEENAKFAAERRQKELDAKVQQELERLKQEAPEFILAKRLSEQMGIPPEQLIEQMREAELQKQAQALKVPVDFLREKEADKTKLTQLENQVNMMSFQNWQGRLQAEGTSLQSQFPMLTREDITQAETYILQVARNVDMPLKQAVFALHGDKIIEGKVIDKTQDTLAAESGRKKKVPLAPNNGKPATAKGTLTSEEKSMARNMGISEADYLKYK